MLPDPNSDELICPRCSAHLWPACFQAAGLRFLVAQPNCSLDDLLLEFLAAFNPDLAKSIRTAANNSDADSFDVIELRLELLDELERHLPELRD